MAHRTDLVCGDPGDAVRNYCACCAPITVTEPCAGSRAFGVDPAFFLSGGNGHWGITFNRRDCGRHEEIAFRGYMQKPLEEAYGIVPAVLIVGIMFWVAHLDHGITITHLPLQMSASIALGLLVYLTRSLIPAMIAHGAADLLLQPAYLFRHPEFVWKALSARPVWEGVASTFPERLLTIGRGTSPKHMFAGDPLQIFAINAWVLLISAALTVFSFVNLARTTRLMRAITP